MSIARNKNETFEAFKARRTLDNEATKAALKPKLFWDSFNDGCYENKEKQAAKQLKGNK